MGRRLLGTLVVLVSGCSADSVPQAGDCSDSGSCTAAGRVSDGSDGAGLGSSRNGAVDTFGPPPVPPVFEPVFVDPRENDAVVGPGATGLGFDPFASPFLGFDGFAGLFASLFEDSIWGILLPAGPRLNESVTFLERLCEDGDAPDSFCRQRFSR